MRRNRKKARGKKEMEDDNRTEIIQHRKREAEHQARKEKAKETTLDYEFEATKSKLFLVFPF